MAYRNEARQVSPIGNPRSLEDSSGLVRIDRAALKDRAHHSLSSYPRPFLRWAGSKRRLLGNLLEVLPDEFRTYHEPFLGGGSLFFLLRPTSARLADSCVELIETYRAIRDNPSAVLRLLAEYPVDRETYYVVRGTKSSAPFRRAARFIYLNKVGWNGLYRVNSRGDFNVPFGAPKTTNVIDARNLKHCATVLGAGDVRLEAEDFQSALTHVRAGDLVFLDPPYVTRHDNNGFVDYNERLFSWEDQERLASEADRIRRLGAKVVVTNANHDDVLSLYPAFRHVEVRRASTLASSSTARGRVSEALLVG